VVIAERGTVSDVSIVTRKGDPVRLGRRFRQNGDVTQCRPGGYGAMMVISPLELWAEGADHKGALMMHVQAPPTRGPTSTAPRPTIVVGYDGTNESRAALTLAAARAGDGGTVVAVFAAQPPSDWLDTAYYDSAVTSRQEATQRIFDELSSIHLDNVTVRAELADGPPARALTEVARLHDAREIVVGSRGLRGIRAALGSVSQRLLQMADRPVVVVPPAGDRAAERTAA
jgi:nucleotide-binding universal stress UspA family protein